MTRDQYMAALVPHALQFVAAIHDDGPGAASEILDAVYALPRPASMGPSRAMMTILAAMVDPTKTRDELLGWVPRPAKARLGWLGVIRRRKAEHRGRAAA